MSERQQPPADDDAHLRAALRHAPDRDAMAPAELSAQILARSRAAVQPPRRAAAAPATAGWFERWFGWMSQPVAAGALGSVLIAGLVGLMWRGGPPPEALPVGADRAADPLASARAPAAPPATVPAPAVEPPAPPPRREQDNAARPPAAEGDDASALSRRRSSANAETERKMSRPDAGPARQEAREKAAGPSATADVPPPAAAPPAPPRAAMAPAPPPTAAPVAPAPPAVTDAPPPQPFPATPAPAAAPRQSPAPALERSAPTAAMPPPAAPARAPAPPPDRDRGRAAEAPPQSGDSRSDEANRGRRSDARPAAALGTAGTTAPAIVSAADPLAPALDALPAGDPRVATLRERLTRLREATRGRWAEGPALAPGEGDPIEDALGRPLGRLLVTPTHAAWREPSGLTWRAALRGPLPPSAAGAAASR